MVRSALALFALVVAPQWTRTDLPVPKAHPDMVVASRGVNVHGAAIFQGTYGPSPATHQLSFLWRNGKLTPLNAGNASWVDVYGINSSGTVVGDAGARAVVWRNAKPTVLARAPSTAQAINDHGTVIGQDDRQATIWQNGIETPLDAIGTVTAINDADQVIGETPVSGGDGTHAMLWQNGVVTDLGSIPGAASWATAINDDGTIVGYLATSLGFPLTAVEWKDGQLIDLGRYGALGAQAVAVNDAGDVLVQLVDDAGQPSSIVLVRDGAPIPVPGSVATTLDDQGQVLGYTMTASHGRRSFVWRDGVETYLPTTDGAKAPWGWPTDVEGGFAVGNEYVPRKQGHGTRHAVLWQRSSG